MIIRPERPKSNPAGQSPGRLFRHAHVVQFDKDWSKISEIEEYRLDWPGRRYVVRVVRHRALIPDEPFRLTVAFEGLQAP